MKLKLEKNGLYYDIKPFFDVSYLFSPITLFLKNRFLLGTIYILIIIIAPIYTFIFLNSILFILGGYSHLVFLVFRNYNLVDFSTKEEVNYFNKLIFWR